MSQQKKENVLVIFCDQLRTDLLGCYGSDLVWNFSDLCELYDLESDTEELHNRFYDPECNQVREKYFSLLAEEAEKVDDGQALKFLRDNPEMGKYEEAAMKSFFQIKRTCDF